MVNVFILYYISCVSMKTDRNSLYLSDGPNRISLRYGRPPPGDRGVCGALLSRSGMGPRAFRRGRPRFAGRPHAPAQVIAAGSSGDVAMTVVGSARVGRGWRRGWRRGWHCPVSSIERPPAKRDPLIDSGTGPLAQVLSSSPANIKVNGRYDPLLNKGFAKFN
jgi:hypothetical protein